MAIERFEDIETQNSQEAQSGAKTLDHGLWTLYFGSRT